MLGVISTAVSKTTDVGHFTNRVCFAPVHSLDKRVLAEVVVVIIRLYEELVR